MPIRKTCSSSFRGWQAHCAPSRLIPIRASFPLMIIGIPGPAFRALDAHIRRHLEIVVPSNTVIARLPSHRSRTFRRRTFLTSAACGAPAGFWACDRILGESELLNLVPRLVKVCSSRFVPELVKRALARHDAHASACSAHGDPRRSGHAILRRRNHRAVLGAYSADPQSGRVYSRRNLEAGVRSYRHRGAHRHEHAFASTVSHFPFRRCSLPSCGSASNGSRYRIRRASARRCAAPSRRLCRRLAIAGIFQRDSADGGLRRRCLYG